MGLETGELPDALPEIASMRRVPSVGNPLSLQVAERPAGLGAVVQEKT